MKRKSRRESARVDEIRVDLVSEHGGRRQQHPCAMQIEKHVIVPRRGGYTSASLGHGRLAVAGVTDMPAIVVS